MRTWCAEHRAADCEALCVFVGLAIALGLVALACLLFAIDHDAGYALATGMAIHDGRLPYRDFFLNWPPGLAYLLAGLQALSSSLWLARTLLLGVNLASACLAGRIAASYAGRRAGAWAALLCLLAILLLQGFRLVNEPFMAFLLLLALWIGWVQRRRPLGALISVLALWFKQPALVAVVAYLALLLWDARGWQERVLVLSFALFAVAAPLALLGSAGLGPAMLAQVVGANLQTAAGRWWGMAEFGKQALSLLGSTGAFWVLCAAGIAEGLASAEHRRGMVGLAGLALGSLLAVVLVPAPHYYVPAAAMGSIGAGMAMAKLVASLPQVRHRLSLVALILVPLLAQGAIPALSVAKQGYLFRQMALGRLIAENTRPDEPILVLTFNPGYYFLAHRYPPGPHFLLSVFVSDRPRVEEAMQMSLGKEVRIAVIVDQPYLEEVGAPVRSKIESCGALLHVDDALRARVWKVDSCR